MTSKEQATTSDQTALYRAAWLVISVLNRQLLSATLHVPFQACVVFFEWKIEYFSDFFGGFAKGGAFVGDYRDHRSCQKICGCQKAWQRKRTHLAWYLHTLIIPLKRGYKYLQVGYLVKLAIQMEPAPMTWLFSTSQGWTALPSEWNNCLHLDMSKAEPFLRPELVAKWVLWNFLLLSGTGICLTTSRSTWSGLCNFSPHNALGMQLCRLIRAVLQSIQFAKSIFDPWTSYASGVLIWSGFWIGMFDSVGVECSGCLTVESASSIEGGPMI